MSQTRTRPVKKCGEARASFSAASQKPLCGDGRPGRSIFIPRRIKTTDPPFFLEIGYCLTPPHDAVVSPLLLGQTLSAKLTTFSSVLSSNQVRFTVSFPTSDPASKPQTDPILSSSQPLSPFCTVPLPNAHLSSSCPLLPPYPHRIPVAYTTNLSFKTAKISPMSRGHPISSFHAIVLAANGPMHSVLSQVRHP